MKWQPIETAPKDGTRFWGWLYDTGIVLMRWSTAEENAQREDNGGEPDEYISCWVKCTDESDGDWSPKFWLPFTAIEVPDGVWWASSINRWRDTTPSHIG